MKTRSEPATPKRRIQDDALTAEQIPAVCTVSDVCRILRMAPSQYYKLVERGEFPLPPIDPPLDSRVRYRGADVRAYIDGDYSRKRSA